MAKLTDQEKKEFSELKRIRCERGFFVPKEKARYNELWDKNAAGTLEALKQFEDIARQQDLN